MVKPRKLFLGAIFVGGLLVSNTANAINGRAMRVISPVISYLSAVCVIHPEYQDKKGWCEVKIEGVYKVNPNDIFHPQLVKGTEDITAMVKGDRDGPIYIDGKKYRNYIVNFRMDGDMYTFVGGIRKPPELCEKDEPYIERDSYRGYTIYFCENGKVTEKQRLVYVESKRLWTMYNSRVWVYSGPSFTRDEYSLKPVLDELNDEQINNNIEQLDNTLLEKNIVKCYLQNLAVHSVEL